MSGTKFLEENKGFFKLPYLYIKHRWNLKLKPIDLMVLEELMYTQRESFRYYQKTLAKTLNVSVTTLEKSIYRLNHVHKLIINIAPKGEACKYDFTPLMVRLEELSQKKVQTIAVPEVDEEVKTISDIIPNNTEYFGKWCDRDLQVKEYQAKVESIWDDMEKEAEQSQITFQATKEDQKKAEWNEYFEQEVSKALSRSYGHLTPNGETPLEKAKWCLKEDYKDRKKASAYIAKEDYFNSLKPDEFEQLLYNNKIEEFKLLSENTVVKDGVWTITVYIGGDIPIEMGLLEYTSMNETDFNLFKEIYSEQSQKSQVGS